VNGQFNYFVAFGTPCVVMLVPILLLIGGLQDAYQSEGWGIVRQGAPLNLVYMDVLD
jgi:hypothetical protein